MKQWFNKRKQEKSTWIGLASLMAGLGAIFKADGVPELADTVAQSADSLAAGDYATPATMVIVGLLSIFAGEKTAK